MAKDKSHKQPTKGELEQEAKRALEEAISPEPEPTPEPTPEPEPDYKKKFLESTREAKILHAKNKKVNEAIEQASGLSDPTEDELRVKYPEWEDMTNTEKTLAREGFISTRRFSVISEATREFKDMDAWVDKVDAFVSDPKILSDHPDLEGKIEEFKVFAGKPSRKGVDFNDLIAAFLYDATRRKPTMKGKMFEIGNGGHGEKPKPKNDKISLDEATLIMKTDYNKYKKLLKDRKIDMTGI